MNYSKLYNKTIDKSYQKAVKAIKPEWFNSFDGKELWYKNIINLRTPHKQTYLVCVLDNQVYNGGFEQYFSNGFGQFAKQTIEALAEIGAENKANILKIALDIVSNGIEDYESFRFQLLHKTIKSLFIDDNLYTPLDKLDDQYEADNEVNDIHKLLGEFIKMNL